MNAKDIRILMEGIEDIINDEQCTEEPLHEFELNVEDQDAQCGDEVLEDAVLDMDVEVEDADEFAPTELGDEVLDTNMFDEEPEDEDTEEFDRMMELMGFKK